MKLVVGNGRESDADREAKAVGGGGSANHRGPRRSTWNAPGAPLTQERPPETNAQGKELTLSDEVDAEYAEPHQAFAVGGALMNGLGRVPGGGIEPPTRGFSVPCSTI